jgi:hypothetical protein
VAEQARPIGTAPRLRVGGRAAHLRDLQQVALLLDGHKGDSRAQAAAHVRRILLEPGLRVRDGRLRGVEYVVCTLSRAGAKPDGRAPGQAGRTAADRPARPRPGAGAARGGSAPAAA